MMMASPLSILSKSKKKAETAIYLQTFHNFRNLIPRVEHPYDYRLDLPREPSPVEMEMRWYMISDSDLHKQHGNNNKRNCRYGKHCDVHKAFPDGRLVGGRGPLPCGDFLDWVSNSTPPSLIGSAGLLAVPDFSSSSTITLFVIGGRDLAAPYGGDATKEVFFRENIVVGMKEDRKETEFNGAWRRGPPMNTARRAAHPVLYGKRIFVFGGTSGSLGDGDRSPLCEVLDLSEENWAWQVLPNPPKHLGHMDIISAHTFSSIDGQEKILLFSPLTDDIISFDPVDRSYDFHARHIGNFRVAAAFLNGIFYGVPRMIPWCNALYYFDFNNTAEFLIDLDLPQSAHVIHNGLIPVGQNLLYVVGAEQYLLEWSPCMPHRVYVLKYRIFKKKINESLKVEAALESKGSYFIHHLESIAGCLAPLAVNLALSKKGSKKGGKASKEGKKRNDTL